MKLKLTLSILLLFEILFQTKVNAQDFKPRPADYVYLSAPDSLGIKHPLLMPISNTKNKRTQVEQIKLPYPIIFIHGLNSNSDKWANMADYLINSMGLSFGGRFDFNLNDDGDNTKANKLFWPTPNADISQWQTNPIIGDFYFLNFDVGSDGSVAPPLSSNTYVLSNQSAIAKQGIVLQRVIAQVMQLTGRDKVILMGHSMGGLAAREYLQNISNWQLDGQHHIAKLVTTGTPHGGSNTAGPDLSLISSILPDPQSEAVRDLRKSYSWSFQPGVFLNGGVESQSVMSDFSLSLNNFYNFDVNCNGIIGENVKGLNDKTPQYDLDYSCIIGNVISLGGDGVVTTNSANLNNIYSGITQNIFLTDTNHLSLTSKSYENMQGLDEPNEYNLAYGIEVGKTYMGFTTVQPVGGYSSDFDDYTFTTTSTSQVNVSVTNVSLPDLMVQIVDDKLNPIGNSGISNGANSISISQTLPAGKYYLEISGTPTPISYLSPYTFKLTTGALSTDNFESPTALNLFPNPTTSKVFFDNSTFNFDNVSVINSLGQEVSKIKFVSFLNNQEVDMSKLPSGVYVLKFINQEGSRTVKVIRN